MPAWRTTGWRRCDQCSIGRRRRDTAIQVARGERCSSITAAISLRIPNPLCPPARAPARAHTHPSPPQDVTLATFASELVYRSMDHPEEDAFRNATSRLADQLGVDLLDLEVGR